jgi:uracil-DNA glycosylase
MRHPRPRSRPNVQEDCMSVTANLAHPGDWAGFTQAVRGFVQQGVAWDAVDWRVADGAGMMLGMAADAPGASDATDGAAGPAGDTHHTPIRMPRSFVDVAQAVMLHSDPTRYLRLHRMVQRIHAQRDVWADTLDAECLHLHQLHRQVRRDMHKMKAFVRFTKVQDDDGDRFVAWFEPQHHIVQATAPFFARRFTAMRWAILTPQTSVQWDGHQLQFGPAASKADAPPPDAGEALWLTYYQRIFNPARVKVVMMKQEMPVRYWRNLPEAQLIAPLLAQATARSGTMVQHRETRQRRLGVATQAAMDATSGGLLSMHRDGETVMSVGAAPQIQPSTQPSLQDLRRQASSCTACPFACNATQTVWGEGHVGAALMLVGEQPGDREDLEGRPFVGPAGQLLRRTIDQLGWPTEQLYLTNAVKHFKYTWATDASSGVETSGLRGQRRLHKTASQREALACSPWLAAEINTVKPRALVALGATAARALLGDGVSVTESAGQWLTRSDGLAVLVVLHPAALLRSGAAQAAGSEQLRVWVQQLAQAGERAWPRTTEHAHA